MVVKEAAICQAMALKAEGLTWQAIGQVLGRHPNTIRRAVRGVLDADLELAEVDPYDLPLETTAGMFWREPRRPPRGKGNGYNTVCDRCEDDGSCRWAVRHGNAIGCESPLKRELDVRWVRRGYPARLRGCKEARL